MSFIKNPFLELLETPAIETFHNKGCHLRCLVLRLIIFVAQVQSCLVLDLRFDETECCQHLPIQPHYDQDKWVDDDDGSESSPQPKQWLSAQAERAARSSLSINTTAAPSSLPSSTASSPSPVPATGESQLGPGASNDRPDYVEISILPFCVNMRSMSFQKFLYRLDVLNCATHSRHVGQDVNPYSGWQTRISNQNEPL